MVEDSEGGGVVKFYEDGHPSGVERNQTAVREEFMRSWIYLG